MAFADSAQEDEFRGLLLRHRGRTALTQAELAAHAGVHTRSVQAWESGMSLPSTRPLQSLIVSLLAGGGFTVGQEMAEAEAMWSAVDRESPRRHAPFDRVWFTAALCADVPQPETPASAPVRSDESITSHALDWGDAPERFRFVGRQAELGALRDAIVGDRTRQLVVSGIGGSGKSTLAARLCRDIASDFERVYWRNMRGAPSFGDWSCGAIDSLSDVQRAHSAEGAAPAETLLELMRQHRCLLVLDNIETLLEPRLLDGSFRAGYEHYSTFLRSAGESHHQSCVLLTSREVPSAALQSGLRVFELGGLQVPDAKMLLDDEGLVGDDDVWTDLVTRYGGNALALRLVGDAIRKLFGGDVAEFMEQVPCGTTFGALRRLFESQLDRLSLSEMEVVRLLAAAREPVSFAALSAQLGGRSQCSVVLEAVETLRHRSLIERVGDGFGFRLPSVVVDYVHENLTAA
jgi:DNA-binding XRE family transcriptional regulator